MYQSEKTNATMSKKLQYNRADTIIESCHAITNMVNEIRLVMTELKFVGPTGEDLILNHAQALRIANKHIDRALNYLGDHINSCDFSTDKTIALTEAAFDMQSGSKLISRSDLIDRIKSLRNTLAVHPQAFEDNSEFSDQVSTTNELLQGL